MLALAILLVLLAAAYLVIIAPVLELYADRAAMLEDRQALMPRLSAAAEQLPALRARLSEVKLAASAHNIMLDGATDAIALATLQSRIEELAASAGVQLGSAEGVATESRGAYRRIGLRFVINGEYAAMIKLLSSIETASPPLVLSSLQFHNALRIQGGDGSVARLDAGFEVYAFRRPDNSVVSGQ